MNDTDDQHITLNSYASIIWFRSPIQYIGITGPGYHSDLSATHPYLLIRQSGLAPHECCKVYCELQKETIGHQLINLVVIDHSACLSLKRQHA